MIVFDFLSVPHADSALAWFCEDKLKGKYKVINNGFSIEIKKEDLSIALRSLSSKDYIFSISNELKTAIRNLKKAGNDDAVSVIFNNMASALKLPVNGVKLSKVIIPSIIDKDGKVEKTYKCKMFSQNIYTINKKHDAAFIVSTIDSFCENLKSSFVEKSKKSNVCPCCGSDYIGTGNKASYGIFHSGSNSSMGMPTQSRFCWNNCLKCYIVNFLTFMPFRPYALKSEYAVGICPKMLNFNQYIFYSKIMIKENILKEGIPFSYDNLNDFSSTVTNMKYRSTDAFSNSYFLASYFESLLRKNVKEDADFFSDEDDCIAKEFSTLFTIDIDSDNVKRNFFSEWIIIEGEGITNIYLEQLDNLVLFNESSFKKSKLSSLFYLMEDIRHTIPFSNKNQYMKGMMRSGIDYILSGDFNKFFGLVQSSFNCPKDHDYGYKDWSFKRYEETNSLGISWHKHKEILSMQLLNFVDITKKKKGEGMDNKKLNQVGRFIGLEAHKLPSGIGAAKLIGSARTAHDLMKVVQSLLKSGMVFGRTEKAKNDNYKMDTYTVSGDEFYEFLDSLLELPTAQQTYEVRKIAISALSTYNFYNTK